MKFVKSSLVVLLAIVFAMIASNTSYVAEALVPGTNQIVTKSVSGALGNNNAGSARLSDNGKVVVFTTLATNILAGGNLSGAMLVREIATGTTALVNVSTNGVMSNNPSLDFVSDVSETGRYVLFDSRSTNLVDDATITGQQLYLRDTKTSTTILVSKSISGAVSNGTYSQGLGISADGRFVAFTSNSTNLNPDSTDGNPHLYFLDRANNTLSILDRKTDGSIGDSNPTWRPSGEMSCDGSMITFNYPGNLIVGDANSFHVDVYLLDRRGSDDKLTNISKQFSRAALGPSISCNGNYVGFKSNGTDIDSVIGVTTNAYRPYVYNRIDGTYHLVAVTSAGSSSSVATCGTGTDSNQCVKLSGNGQVVFNSNDSSLTGVSGAHGYIRDISAGTTELLTKNTTGDPANAGAGVSGISADGSRVLIGSSASNLAAGDTNAKTDYFIAPTSY